MKVLFSNGFEWIDAARKRLFARNAEFEIFYLSIVAGITIDRPFEVFLKMTKIWREREKKFSRISPK